MIIQQKGIIHIINAFLQFSSSNSNILLITKRAFNFNFNFIDESYNHSSRQLRCQAYLPLLLVLLLMTTRTPSLPEPGAQLLFRTSISLTNLPTSIEKESHNVLFMLRVQEDMDILKLLMMFQNILKLKCLKALERRHLSSPDFQLLLEKRDQQILKEIQEVKLFIFRICC